MDLIGPWIVQDRGTPHQFDTLTAIVTVTNLVETVRSDSKDSDYIERKFVQYFVDLLPMATTLHHDPGGEFTGPEFQTLLQNCYIRDVCTTAKNPQSNTVCERMHQTVETVLRTLLHGDMGNHLKTLLTPKNVWMKLYPLLCTL